jgi:hypothetical protein
LRGPRAAEAKIERAFDLKRQLKNIDGKIFARSAPVPAT